jgi:hypothetical protein
MAAHRWGTWTEVEGGGIRRVQVSSTDNSANLGQNYHYMATYALCLQDKQATNTAWFIHCVIKQVIKQVMTNDVCYSAVLLVDCSSCYCYCYYKSGLNLI